MIKGRNVHPLSVTNIPMFISYCKHSVNVCWHLPEIEGNIKLKIDVSGKIYDWNNTCFL